ncbi:hypothetical protein BH10ACT8_BH10ACT8_18270 [soil metagenome]
MDVYLDMAQSQLRQAPGPHFQLYASGPGARVNWRLLSGNNRDLGRGCVSSENPDECRVAILSVVRGLPDTTSIIRPGSQNRWVWALLLNGLTVAASGRDYDRQVRCEAARVQFIEYAQSAPIDLTVMFTGARRSSPSPLLRSAGVLPSGARTMSTGLGSRASRRPRVND